MRVAHFEALQPICPKCKAEFDGVVPLKLGRIERRDGDTIIEGALVCESRDCGAEYPILDGVPIILADTRKYIAENFVQIAARDDISPATESVLGAALGPGTDYNTTRHWWSTYSWDHYGDFAPAGLREQEAGCPPGNVLGVLTAGLGLLHAAPQPPALDIGCSSGRTTFELAARCGGLVLGADLNFRQLREAQRLLRTGRVSIPLKTVGYTFQRHEFAVSLPHAERVDFWACDALGLPFAAESFQTVSALNVFDVCNSPIGLLEQVERVLAEGGQAILSSPYDWSPPVPVAQWSAGMGGMIPENELPLRVLLTPRRHPQSMKQLALTGEIEHHPWSVRVHRRRTARYDAHIVACTKNE